MTVARPARRVVITGLGVVCPLGNSPQALWDGLSAGHSGVRAIDMFPAEALPMQFGGVASEFISDDVSAFGDLDKNLKRTIKKGFKTICREAQMGIAAAQLAMQHGGITPESVVPERIGSVFGSDYMITWPHDFVDACKKCLDAKGRFEYARWAAEGLPAMNPLWLLKYLPNMPAAHLSMYNDLRGPNNSLTEREASGNLAIGEAARIIARGHADWMVAGSTGTWVHPYRTLVGVLQLELATAGEPQKAHRPFDKHRSGSVLGEGAGAVILEDLETAQRRGAKIHGEVVGSASSQAIDRDFAARYEVALANVLRGALRDAKLEPKEVGHVHAHGLATRSCDQAEALAIGRVFGDEARRVPVVAAKANFGNLGAGAGAVELIASLMATQQGRLFPAINYQTPDPACPLNVVTDGEIPSGDVFLNVNVSAQGQASCLAVRRFTSS